MNKIKEIKKLVSYGLITLIGFSLFTGCEDEIIIASEEESISFNMRLPIDENGYYHLTINRDNWQTLHRVSGSVNTVDGNPIEFFWVEWESDLYWYLGDTLGYIVNRNFNDGGTYVSVDTSYMIGFSGMEVPTSNIVIRQPKLLEKITILDEKKNKYSVEEFLDLIQKWKIIT